MSARATKFSTLAELKHLKGEIAARTMQQTQQSAATARAKEQAQSEKQLFARAAGPVQPLTQKCRACLTQTPSAARSMQHQRDQEAVMRESLSDEFDVSTLLDSDDSLSFRRAGIGVDVTRKLRRGDWRLQGQIDLHGMRRDEAREHLNVFIREAHLQGLRCVRVVHGKGLGSPGKAPVLKSRVHSWLAQKHEVLAFVQARPVDGGAGALVVLLAPVRS